MFVKEVEDEYKMLNDQGMDQEIRIFDGYIKNLKRVVPLPCIPKLFPLTSLGYFYSVPYHASPWYILGPI